MKRTITLLAGAWVLWKQTIAVVPAIVPGTHPVERLIVTWQPQAPYETKEACEEAARAVLGGKLLCLPAAIDAHGRNLPESANR